MGSIEDTTGSEEVIDSAGAKKYGRLVRMLRDGYLSICIYKNVHERKTFYDIVLYRKIKVNGVVTYKRGTNLKPSDLPHLRVLIQGAEEFLASCE